MIPFVLPFGRMCRALKTFCPRACAWSARWKVTLRCAHMFLSAYVGSETKSWNTRAKHLQNPLFAEVKVSVLKFCMAKPHWQPQQHWNGALETATYRIETCETAPPSAVVLVNDDPTFWCYECDLYQSCEHVRHALGALHGLLSMGILLPGVDADLCAICQNPRKMFSLHVAQRDLRQPGTGKDKGSIPIQEVYELPVKLDNFGCKMIPEW